MANSAVRPAIRSGHRLSACLAARSGSTSGLFDALEPRQLLSNTVSNGLDAFFANLALTLQANHNGEEVAFGRAVVNLGDLNADGADELAIGAPGGGSAMGLVDVYSGKTGTRLWTVTGDAVGFGRSLARLVDVTGDSIADLAVGSPSSGSAGSVFIYNGATGALFGQIIGSEHGAAAGANFGWSIASGTLDADASPDLAIGAPTDGASTAGRVYLIGASNAGLLGVIEGGQSGELFGWAVAVGRTKSQPVDDVMVGAPAWDTDASNDHGRVSRYRAAGTEVFTIAGRDPGDMAGYSVLAMMSNDGDYADLAFGSPGADAWAMDSILAAHAGIVQIVDFGGLVSATFAGTQPGSLFGASLAQVRRPGDYYSPWPLLAIGAPGAAGGGEVQIHDSTRYTRNYDTIQWVVPTHTTATMLFRFHGDPDRAFGVALALGDFNGDGIADIAAADALDPGVITNTTINETSSGEVRVYSALDQMDHFSADAMSANTQFAAVRSDRMRTIWLAGPTGFTRISTDTYSNDRVIDVTDQGKVLIERRTDTDAGTFFAPFTFENGVLTNVLDTVTSFVGAPAEWTFYTGAEAVALLPDGSALIDRWVTNLGSPVVIMDRTIWRVEGTTATYLWRGQYGASSAGGVVGRRIDDYDSTTGEFFWTTMLWRSGVGVEAVTGLQNAGAIDASGSIIAVNLDTKTVVKRDVDGTIHSLFTVDTEFAVTIHPKSVDENGRVLWFIAENNLPPGPPPWYWYAGELRLFDPQADTNVIVAESAVLLQRVSYGGATTSSFVRFTEPGGFMVFGTDEYSVTGLALYTPGVDARITTPADLATVATATGEQWTASLFINSLGRLTLMLNEGDGIWRIRNVATDSSSDGQFDGYVPIAAWVDPLSKKPQFSTFNSYLQFAHIASWDPSMNSGKQLYALWQVIAPQLGGAGTDGSGTFLTQTIGPSRDMTVLVRPDDLVIVAVRMNDGRVVLIGQAYRSNVNPFGFNILYDLTYSELTPRGLPTPEIVGPISGFVSPWGGHNVTGVDASGHIWTLWTSPEFVGWTITDLTDWLHADPISGGVTSFLTSWNAFNITGLNSPGELVTMWWAPELGDGNWQIDLIGQGQTTWDTAVQLESWFNAVEQSLNFVGKDQTGQITCYTWSVSDQTWRSEVVQPITAPDRVSRVSPDGGRPTVSRAVGLGASGHLLWFYRTDDVATWAFEDITELIA